MQLLNDKFGYIGVALGGVALLLALIHFWAGPFAPQPNLETVVAERAVEIRQATIRALQGDTAPEKKTEQWDADRLTQVVTAALGGLAIVFAAVAFVRREGTRAVAAGALLGASAIAFQFLSWLAIALLVVILISAVLQSLGGTIGLD